MCWFYIHVHQTNPQRLQRRNAKYQFALLPLLLEQIDGGE